MSKIFMLKNVDIPNMLLLDSPFYFENTLTKQSIYNGLSVEVWTLSRASMKSVWCFKNPL